MISRRRFLSVAMVSTMAPAVRLRVPRSDEWGSPVFDFHAHLRARGSDNTAHLDGVGIAKANLLSRATAADRVLALQAEAPGRFVWFANADVSLPEGVEALRKAVKDGARGFGEMKYHFPTDGVEFRRAYALAAELNVPILIHFQEVDHFENEGTWSPGFAEKFESVLKAFPQTTFIGHADAFWANVSADYRNQAAYPSGPIARGGITDRLLGDYPNLYGDISANSGNNMLSRDPEFTRDFLRRHQDKLLFGSDCGCADGRGAGVSQANNPAASRLAGKCVARETLTLLQRSTTREAFRKIVWDNAHRLLKIP